MICNFIIIKFVCFYLLIVPATQKVSVTNVIVFLLVSDIIPIETTLQRTIIYSLMICKIEHFFKLNY